MGIQPVSKTRPSSFIVLMAHKVINVKIRGQPARRIYNIIEDEWLEMPLNNGKHCRREKAVLCFIRWFADLILLYIGFPEWLYSLIIYAGNVKQSE